MSLFTNFDLNFLSLTGASVALAMICCLFYIHGNALINNRKFNKKSIIYTVFILLVAIWGVGLFLSFSTYDKSKALFWGRFLNSAAILILPFFNLFVFSYLEKVNLWKRYLFTCFLLCGAYFIGTITFYKFFVSDVSFREIYGVFFRFYPDAGKLYYIFPILYLIYAVVGNFQLYKTYKNSIGETKQNLKYIFYSSAIAFSGGLTTFPLVFKIPVPPVGASLVAFLFIGILFGAIKSHVFGFKFKRSISVNISFGIISLVLYVSLSLIYKNFVNSTVSEYVVVFYWFCAFAFLLTESNKMVKEIEVKERELALKNNFLKSMSHELRTPLNPLIGISNFLVENEKIKNDPELNEMSGNLSKSFKRMLESVDNLLIMHELIEKNVTLNNKEFLLKDLLWNVHIFKELIDNKKLEFFQKNDLSKTILIQDVQKIEKILTCILDNAIKFSPNGDIKFSIELSSDQLIFEVCDSGIGISPDKFERILEPFGKDDEADNRAYQGCGLGLSISASYVELMAGKLNIQNNQNKKGVTVTIFIPVTVSKKSGNFDSETVVTSLKSAEYAAPHHILIVDDDEFNRALLKSVFKKETTLNVEIVDSGKKCLEKISNMNYDLILLDIQMPEMDGKETFQHIKEAHIDTKVMAFTAHTMDVERDELLNLGFYDLIEKPFTEQGLLNKILKNI